MSFVRNFLRKGRQALRAVRSTAHGFQSEKPFSLLGLEEFRREHFPDCGPFTWLDRPDALDSIEARLRQGEINEQQAAWCRQWVEHGYLVVERLFSSDEMQRVWASYERDFKAQRFNAANPGLDSHLRCHELNELIHSPKLMDICALLLGVKPAAFQSIVREFGSQQAAHSDAIHMTTHPLGYLAAAWVALEDIHPDSGPLFYYPGSHRLPYFLSKEVGISSADHLANPYKAYATRYEPFIDKVIRENNLQRKTFTPPVGSVLFWHHNLLHGGSEIKNKNLTRKDVVFHYFSENVVCYHDLSASLAERRF